MTPLKSIELFKTLFVSITVTMSKKSAKSSALTLTVDLPTLWECDAYGMGFLGCDEWRQKAATFVAGAKNVAGITVAGGAFGGCR